MAFKKRWLFAMLAWILVFSLLSACAGEKSTPATTEPPITTPTPKSKPTVAPIPVDEVSLEEAEKIIGAPITPKYLPAGCKFQRGFVRYRGSPPRADLTLLFSDEEVTEEVETLRDLVPLIRKIAQPGASGRPKLVLLIDKIRGTVSPDIHEKMAEEYGGKVMDISGIKGWLATGASSYQLSWFESGLRLEIRAVAELSEEELMRIAQSIG